MKRLLAALLVVAAASVGCFFYGRNAVPAKSVDIGRQQTAASAPRPITIDNQNRCAEQAREAFRRDGWDLARFTDLSDHYNERLKRCFIEIDVIITNGKDSADFIRSFGDAEGREYGVYAQVIKRGTDPSETSPTTCEVTLPSGEEMECHSLEQFDEFVGGYIE